MASFGGMYTGALCHYVYPWYPKLVTRFMPKLFQSSALWIGLGCTVIDNFIHNPIFYIPAFYLYTDTVQGASFDESCRHLRSDWVSVASTCWIVWVPLQTLNFSVVPPSGRIIFVNVCNLVWNVVIDFLSHDNDDHAAARSIDVDTVDHTCSRTEEKLT